MLRARVDADAARHLPAAARRRSSASPTSRELVPVPARPRRLAPVPVAVAAGARRLDARLRRRRPDARVRGARRRGGAARARAARGPARSCSTSSRTTWATRRREPLVGRPASCARGSSTSTRRPAATGASSTSTTSPACASRTPRSSTLDPRARCSSSCADGVVDGLRVDHPDGLADPAGYLERLRDARRRARLGREDPRTPARRCATGRSRARSATSSSTTPAALFVDPAGEAPLTDAVRRADRRDARRSTRSRSRRSSSRRATTFAREVERLRALLDDPGELARGAGARCRSTAPTSSRGRARRGRRPRGGRGAGRRTRCADVLLLRRARPRRVRHPLPADLAAGDGEGRRGHRLLPLPAPARAQRGRRRPGRFGLLGRRASTPRTPSARERFPRGLLVTQTHDTKRSGDVRARIGALAGDRGRVGASTCARWRELNAALRADGAPDAHERVPDLPDARRRLADRARAPRGLPREGAARGQAQHELGRARTTTGRRASSASRVALLDARAVPRRLRAVRRAASRAAGERSALGQLLLKLTVARRRPTSTRATSSRSLSRSSTPTTAGRSTGTRAAPRSTPCAAAPRRRDETMKLHLIARALDLRARAARRVRRRLRAASTPGRTCARSCAARRGARRWCSCGRRARRCCAASPGRWRDVLTGDERDLGDEAAVADVVDANGLALLERA